LSHTCHFLSSHSSFHHLVYMIHFRQLSSFPPLFYSFPMFSFFFPLHGFSFSFVICFFRSFLSPSCSVYPFVNFFLSLSLSSHCFILCLVSLLSFHLLLCTF
jgi:hypothetical protein